MLVPKIWLARQEISIVFGCLHIKPSNKTYFELAFFFDLTYSSAAKMAASLSNAASVPVISTVLELEKFLSSISRSSTLYVNLEGNSLSRWGTISLISINILPQKTIRIIDVLVLGEATFTTPSKKSLTLKSILENPNIPKCFWDVRNDADALWAHYNVSLAGIVDIQLIENMSRIGGRTYLRGLDQSIENDLNLEAEESSRRSVVKKEITTLMTTNIFDSRPMDPQTVEYCVDGVVHLPDLQALYLDRMQGDWLSKVMKEGARRVNETHSPKYAPKSAFKMYGPWGD